MRIFLFLPQLPYPAHSGGRIVTAPLVEGLAARHEVHLFSLTHGWELEEEGKQKLSAMLAGVHTVRAGAKLDARAFARFCLGHQPYKTGRFHLKSLEQIARSAAMKNPPDVIHCQNFYTAGYAPAIPAPRKVIYHENFESLLLERRAASTTNPLLRKLVEIEQRRTLRYELESSLWFHKIITISRADEDCFRNCPASDARIREHLSRNLRTIMPSINLDFYAGFNEGDAPSPYAGSSRKHIVFAGSFNYEANINGALWFVRNVLPLLDKDKYDVWLVGQQPARAIQELRNPPLVHVTGSVPDMRPYLHHAHASIVPLWIGGGIRLKILESLSVGCPVVSTSIGCEGLWDDQHPPLWEIADNPEEFAAAIRKTCHQEAPRDEMRRWAENRFSPARFIAEMEEIYSSED